MLDICLLGNGGTQPLPNRWLTSLITAVNGKMLLVDCGEGTQIALKILGWGLKSIDIILLTHFHGDHVAGLPGLLLTMGKSGRDAPLLIVGPQGLTKIVEGLTVIAPHLPYQLSLMEIPYGEQTKIIFGRYNIENLYVDHTIPCMSYSIAVERGRKFCPQKAKEQNIPLEFWGKLQKGEKIASEGRVFTPDMVLGEKRHGLKLCYCTDTRPVKELEAFINNADLFICEGMYAEDEKLYKAEKNKHMLFSEAAQLAKIANVNELWLTHFSPSLTKPKEFLGSAKEIFNNVIIGESGMKKTLVFSE